MEKFISGCCGVWGGFCTSGSDSAWNLLASRRSELKLQRAKCTSVFPPFECILGVQPSCEDVSLSRCFPIQIPLWPFCECHRQPKGWDHVYSPLALHYRVVSERIRSASYQLLERRMLKAIQEAPSAAAASHCQGWADWSPAIGIWGQVPVIAAQKSTPGLFSLTKMLLCVLECC